MKKQNNIESLEKKLRKLLKEKSPLPPLNNAFFINGLEINVNHEIDKGKYVILLEDGKFYELLIEIDSLSSGNLDILANRNEQIIPIDFTRDEKIIYINAALESLKSF
ncbi:MAG: hypothetical protein ACJ0J6_00485 [Dehalococcoidia bacterium]|tara:strand:+ start:1364 stop:1687 length:324 start_codon:yes stop_codon:yes gene_type:complete